MAEDFSGTTGGVVAGPVQIDVLGSPQFAGSSAGKKLLASGFDINCLRPCADGIGSNGEGTGRIINVNATLLNREWILFDNTVQQVARERLPITQALLARGLVYPIANALGVMSIEWQRNKGDLADAEITMSGLTGATKDMLEYDTVNMPVPIFHKEFFYDLRHLAAARRNGRNPDIEHASVATRKIAELIESVVFNGLTIGGQTIYGLRTEPNRKTASVSVSWATATGEQMISDVIRFIEIMAGPPNNMEGPFVLILPRTLASRLGEDYKANSDKTIRQRLMEIEGLAGVWSSSRLTGTSFLLVQLTSDVIQLIDGIQPTLVEWDSHGGFQQNFKIIAIMLPRVRSNGWQQSGILQAS